MRNGRGADAAGRQDWEDQQMEALTDYLEEEVLGGS